MVTENIRYFYEVFVSIFSYIWLKFFIASGLIVLGFFFDTVHQSAMTAILVLIFMDFATALLACVKCDQPFKSHKVLRSAIKVAVYFTLISAAFQAEKAIPVTFVDEAIIGFLAATELLSILENVSRAGYAVPQGLVSWLKAFGGKKLP